MRIGFFRKIRRKRVIRLEEDLDYGIDKVMRERWNFLTLIEVYQNLNELENLIQKYPILESEERDLFLRDIQKIKETYPFDKTHNAPHWNINKFINDTLWLSGNFKNALTLTSESTPKPHSPLARALKIVDSFLASAEKRRDIIAEEEKRITTFILIALQKHIRYMELIISILIIAIGVTIGWFFSR